MSNVCFSVSMFVCLPIYLFTYNGDLYIYVYIFTYLLIKLSACIHLPLYLSNCKYLSINLPTYQSVHLITNVLTFIQMVIQFSKKKYPGKLFINHKFLHVFVLHSFIALFICFKKTVLLFCLLASLILDTH